MGVASMVIGIVALVIGFIPFCGAWAVIPAVIGLGLGIADLVVRTKRGQPRGMAIAGMVLNPAAILVIVLYFFFFAVSASQGMQDATWQMQQWPPGMQQGGPPGFPATPPGPSGWPGQPGQPGPPMQPMQPMQPVPPDQPAAPVDPPQPVPVQPAPPANP